MMEMAMRPALTGLLVVGLLACSDDSGEPAAATADTGSA